MLPVLTHATTTGHDVACVMVHDCTTGHEHFGFSQSRPYPLGEVQAMHRKGGGGEAIGRWCEEYYRRADLSCSRAQQITSCTELVLSEFPASSR